MLQAGLPNDDKIVKIPAGITRLFQSHLDWNLYSNKQPQLHNRQVPVINHDHKNTMANYHQLPMIMIMITES